MKSTYEKEETESFYFGFYTQFVKTTISYCSNYTFDIYKNMQKLDWNKIFIFRIFYSKNSFADYN